MGRVPCLGAVYRGGVVVAIVAYPTGDRRLLLETATGTRWTLIWGGR